MSAGRHRRNGAAAFALFVLLAVVHTWPLAARPGTWSRVNTSDYLLNTWAIDWVARTLPRDPAHLFDANIFHPHRYTLAYSEPLILHGILAMPVLWLGGSPVLAHNLVLLAGFALTGWAFAWYVHRLTASWGAGLVAGSLVAFNAHQLVRLAHVQALHLELLPLIFVAFDRLLAGGRLRDAAALGVAVAAQATISIYLLVFAAWALVTGALARVREWTGRSRWRLGVLLLLAAAISLLAALPVLWPYVTLARTQRLGRGADDAVRWAASWSDYLFTGARVHFDLWSYRFRRSPSAIFPGIVATLLVLVALGRAWRSQVHVRMWAAVVAGAVLLSIAPHLPGFEAVHGVLPPLRAIRAFSRAGQIVLVGIGVLAGFGAAWLLSRVPGSRRVWLAAGLLLLVNLEALRAPFRYVEFRGIPPIYDVLAAERDAVVLELPFFRRRQRYGNADYMLYATRHRHPLVNGYSGFVPPDYDRIATEVRRLPAPEAVEFLRGLGVTHVVVHERGYGRHYLAAVQAAGVFDLVASLEGVSLFRLSGVP